MGVIDSIDSPGDLKQLNLKQLSQLSFEIRRNLIDLTSQTGGHLASNLGVVELTIALHYCFNTPRDKILWDVGHQSYVHKILTGRKDRMHTLRQYKGISGFPKMGESEHDCFGCGHASTSISAALGFAAARDLNKGSNKVIAVIGDGALTGGMAFEGLNHAAHLKKDMIVILNDNSMSISPNIGGLSNYLNRLITTRSYILAKYDILKAISSLPIIGKKTTKKIIRFKELLKSLLMPGIFFEELGYKYYGPIDGHNINQLIKILSNVKNMKRPVLLHVITKKGKGYLHAENNATKFHGIDSFNKKTGENNNKKDKITFTQAFSDAMVELAGKDKRIVAITAAMRDGTGLLDFSKKFPERFFDVGIAEQHAVTFASGLAAGNIKPVVAIYSTFLQRAFDQIIHDVCLQKLDVTFAIDRSGIVGSDGATHNGTFDISYLRQIPNLVVMSPKDENELKHMLHTAIQYDGPAAIRYPRGNGSKTEIERKIRKIHIGKSEILNKGKDLVLVGIGSTVKIALETADELNKKGIKATVINARFVKPLDPEIIEIIKKTGKAITIEENTGKGGFGSLILEELSRKKIKADVRVVALPDKYIEHGGQDLLRDKHGLNTKNILKTATELVKRYKK